MERDAVLQVEFFNARRPRGGRANRMGGRKLRGEEDFSRTSRGPSALRIGQFGANSSRDLRGLRAHLCRVERGESAVDNQDAAITEMMDSYQLYFLFLFDFGDLGNGWDTSQLFAVSRGVFVN